jgi:hypothetical protein
LASGLGKTITNFIKHGKITQTQWSYIDPSIWIKVSH